MINRVQELANNPLIKRIVHGGSWTVVGDIGYRIFPFIASVLGARLLGVTEFGAFVMVQATASAFTALGSFNMGNTATKFVAEYHRTQPEKTNGIITISLIIAALTGLLASMLLFYFSPLVAEKVLARSDLIVPLRWAAPMLLFTALYSAISGVLMGFEKTRLLAGLNISTSIINSLLPVIGIYLNGIIGGAIGMMLGSLIQFLVFFYILATLSTELKFTIYSKQYLKELDHLWHFSLPATLAGIMHIPVIWIAQAIIANQPSGYEQVGLYNAAQKWQTMIVFFPMAFSAIYLPVLSSIKAENNYNKYLRTTHILAFSNLFCCIPIAIPLFFFSTQVMQIFGDDFSSGSELIKGIVILSFVSALLHVYWQALIGLGKAWISFYMTTLFALMVITLTWIFREKGAEGYLLAFLISTSIRLVMHIFYLNILHKNRVVQALVVK